MDKEGLIRAYMMEYGLSREAAEEKADKAIKDVADLYQIDEQSEEDAEELYDISEVICVKCLERWIAVRPSSVMLKDLECPRCKYTGSTIETGQEFYMEDIGEDDGEDDGEI